MPLRSATGTVSPHFPWDKVSDYNALRQEAAQYSLGFDAVNSNTFQDQKDQRLSYKFGSLSHADKGEPGNQVRLMSMHASKGLEFRFVFIVGVEDGNLPHEASIEEGRIDEERRLLYVGITRAKERLWLSHAREAQRWGDRLRLKPSRFLDELPADELQRDGADPVADAAHKAERRSAGIANIRALLAD